MADHSRAITAKAEKTRRTVQALLRSLARHYGPRRQVRSKLPLDDLLVVLMVPPMSETAARRALRKLRAHYVDWNEVRVSQFFEVRKTLGVQADAENGYDPARRIVTCLREIFQRRGNLDLGPLLEVRASEARGFLTSLDSVDKGEVPAILLMAFHKSVLPINDEILRVNRRVGLVVSGAPAGVAQKLLEEALKETELYPYYRLMREHAGRCCTEVEPKCKTCPIRLQCASRDQLPSA